MFRFDLNTIASTATATVIALSASLLVFAAATLPAASGVIA